MIPRYLSPLESKPCNGSRIRRLLSVKSDLQETPLPPDPFKKPQPSPPPEKPTDGLAGSEVWWLLYRTKFTEASAHPRCHRHTSSTAVSSTQKPLFFFFFKSLCTNILYWALLLSAPLLTLIYYQSSTLCLLLSVPQKHRFWLWSPWRTRRNPRFLVCFLVILLIYAQSKSRCWFLIPALPVES